MAKYDRVVGRFTELVDSISADQWSLSTPCEGWTIRDLMHHIVVRDDRISATVGGEPQVEPDAGADLTVEWRRRLAWWAAGLADPVRSATVWTTAMGEMTFQQAADRFMTGELLIHTWDLARALGVDDTLDAEAVRTTFVQMQAYGDLIRRPGAMGPAIDAPAEADEQTRLIAFTGRAT